MTHTMKGIRNEWIVWLGIGLYTIILTALCWYKYYQLGYNVMDLAIINNAFYHAAHGHGFWSSIQGNSYFAYHFSPILYLLLPLYYLWQSPLNLLMLQTILLGLSAWPVFLLAKKIINERWAMWITLAYLLNPLLWNINIFEWHAFVLLLPAALVWYYAYVTKKYWWWMFWLVILLAIREDAIVIAGGFLILALWEKRSWRWWLIGGAISVAAFLGSLHVINGLSHDGSRFLLYYQWLFTTPPWMWLAHLLQGKTWGFFLGWSLAFLFLPWLKPKYLMLMAAPILQLGLIAENQLDLMLYRHYGVAVIITGIVGSIWGLSWLHRHTGVNPMRTFLAHKPLTISILTTCIIYLTLFLGPGWGFVQLAFKPPYTNDHASWIGKLQAIPAHASVAANYQSLAMLSSRLDLYSWRYIVTGHQQFSTEVYPYTDPDYIVLTNEDLLQDYLMISNSGYYHAFYPEGYYHVENLLSSGYRLAAFTNATMIWQRDSQAQPFEQSYPATQQQMTGDHYQIGPLTLTTERQGQYIKLYWHLPQATTTTLFIDVSIDGTQMIRQPLLFTPTTLWQPGLAYTSRLYVPWGTKKITFQPLTVSGHLGRNALNNTQIVVSSQPLTKPVEIFGP